MATDKVQICNRALINLGCNVINSFDDTTTEAAACSVIWDPLRTEVLNSFPWTFATKRAQCAVSVTPPAFDYAYRYKLPSDCLWVYQVYQDCDYKIEQGGYIATNKNSCLIKYIYDDDDTSSWSPDFCALMAAGMAKELAYTFPRQITVGVEFDKIFQQKLLDAQGRDALQQPADNFGQNGSSFIAARFGKYGSASYDLSS